MSVNVITQGWGAGLAIPITVTLPPFPNVPLLPGVPQLARSLLFPTSAPPAVGTPATAGVLWHATQAAPVWGVFDSDNNQAIIADSVQEFGYRQEYRISSYQVQAGQFASYNKVIVPFETSIMLTKGGSVTERSTFLQQCAAVVASLNLYTVRTPEQSYPGVNCTRFELSRRGAGAATFFDVELFFTQVIEVQSQYSSTSATDLSNASVPSAVPPLNNGVVSPSVPTTAVQSAALAAVTPPNDELAFLKMLAQ